MDKKYWVPALERAHTILREIAAEPGKLKLTDLCSRSGISKSTMFSLLQTMEQLQWIERDRADAFSLGVHFGMMGNVYFQQFDLIDVFRREAPTVMARIEESVQLARLEGDQVVYLAKEAAPKPVQMVSGPGARFPAYATALGKMLLTALSEEALLAMYPEEGLNRLTPHTVNNRTELLEQIALARRQGFAEEMQEGVMGFCCVAAPIIHPGGQMLGAVSVSMPVHEWDHKREDARRAAITLAGKLSYGKAE
ncbi:IclR family transcriptional regulator [Paenibacillus thalictri]|uniref:IclR family transcriptional regulator n=1 Tax=Paenibacillus thalictri TaxID=2527873 RepID=A0A4Q9DI11_9BACL|nr:IclR family transcriptional regulator [Paenibacillus thalictri]TBL71198.1 IclR family transcriptional regulator [Paenibacillus thalictri]